MKPLSEFCCINIECSEHGKRGGENIRVHQTYGNSDTIRLLECKVCGHKFSERAHTVYQEVVFPETRSSPYSIIWLKGVGNDGSADWWE